jgi:hypothetical protein
MERSELIKNRLKLIFTLLFSFFFLTIRTSEANNNFNNAVLHYNYEIFVLSINLTECALKRYSIGSSGEISDFQIMQCRLKDYNRITGKNYSMNDLYNYFVGREIFDFYATKIGISENNFERIAKQWNASSNWKGEAAQKYWNKVQKYRRKVIKNLKKIA